MKTGRAEVGPSEAESGFGVFGFEFFRSGAVFLVGGVEDAMLVDGLVEAIAETLTVIERAFPKRTTKDLAGELLYQQLRRGLE